MQIERASRRKTEPPVGAPKRSPSPTRWLVARDGNGRLEPLCVHAGGAKALPVFSFEEEAEMFLHLGGFGGDGWRARETSAGELVSVLCGPCADAEVVALDPLPGPPRGETAAPVEVGRARFLEEIAGEAKRPLAQRAAE